ncbi:PadR family transcriptional regulator [Dehalogenimonas sp. THU2]|uniref:PadR family transcriptional regulator n=1 Tax=Dehalogenimonas sp. THU2 TaxID=3151121 RepID=UPI00321889F4
MKLFKRLHICCHMSPRWPSFGPARAKRFFEKGVLRFVLLDLLKDKPAHGYELIRALEERSHGFYTPSPGSVYPILQTLQEQGYVTSVENTGRKTYTITAQGLEYLSKHSDIIDGLNNIAAHKGHFNQAEWKDTVEQLQHLRQLFGRKIDRLNPEQKAAIRETIKRASRDIESIIEGKGI